MKIETTILQNLIQNHDYATKVLPFLQLEYFKDLNDARIFAEVKSLILKYNKSPDVATIRLELQELKGMSQDGIEKCKLIMDAIEQASKTTDDDWLIDATEKFCQKQSIYLAMVESMAILSGDEKNKTEGAIPGILSEALAISFDPSIGHDYLENSEEQYDFYHRIENKIRFDLEMFNRITNKGIPEKTLTVCLAGTHVGKSLLMCSFAGGYLSNGYDVLYITMEMAEEEIVSRIDANLLNCNIDELDKVPKNIYMSKTGNVKTKTNGKLIVKEYPTGSANALHFKNLLEDLKLKKDFEPQVIFIDYINICSSARIKPGAVNSYEYIKSIATELRGLAVEKKTRIFTATQTNREGFASSDPDLTSTAESFSLPGLADFMFAIVNSEELEKLNQLMVIQLKNRFGDVGKNKRFVVGIDRLKMRLYDTDDSSQDDIINQDNGYNKPKTDMRTNEEKTKDWKF